MATGGAVVARPRFSGAVLCGGASTRMGRDKATTPIGGRPMAQRVALALEEAGATEVYAVGGDAGALRALGLEVVPDDAPGDGPLPATVTALRRAREDLVVVLGCDLLHPNPEVVEHLVTTLLTRSSGDVAVPVDGEHHHWVHAAWRAAALAHLTAAMDGGARSLRRAAAWLSIVEVPGIEPRWLADADEPSDLPGSLAADGDPPGGRA